MSYGLRFKTADGYIIIDGKRMIPQLIGTYNMGDYTYSETSDTGYVQPGWIKRMYDFPYPPAVFSRPIVIFVQAPTGGGDVWVGQNGTVVMYKSGATVNHPKIFVFGVDYVSPGSGAYGLQIKSDTGAILYDSRNQHLTIQQIVGNLTHSISHNDTDHKSNEVVTSHTAPAALPAAPALALPFFEYFVDFRVRFSGDGDERCHFFYRVRGNIIDAVMLRTEYSFVVTGDSAPSYYNLVHGRYENVQALVIDSTIYS